MYLPGVNKLTLSAAALAAMVEDHINRDQDLDQRIRVDPAQVHIWQSPDGTRSVEFTVSSNEAKPGGAATSGVIGSAESMTRDDALFGYESRDDIRWPLNYAKRSTL